MFILPSSPLPPLPPSPLLSPLPRRSGRGAAPEAEASRPLDDDRYTGPNAIFAAVESGDVQLVKLSWLRQPAEEQIPVPLLVLEKPASPRLDSPRDFVSERTPGEVQGG